MGKVPQLMNSMQENYPCRRREGSTGKNDTEITQPPNRRPPPRPLGSQNEKEERKNDKDSVCEY